MEKKWFRRKLYGWGWYPSSWQGWLLLVVYILYIVWCYSWIEHHAHSAADLLMSFIPRCILATAILIFVCIKKGEKPRWQWGKRIED